MNGQNSNENNNNNQKIREKESNKIINENNNYKKNTNDKKQALSLENNNNNMEVLKLNIINEEYDVYISNLKEKLSFLKVERKKTENKYNTIKHRLIKLKNQEKTNNINFQNIKYRFKKILNNRMETQKKLNKNRKVYFSSSKYKIMKKNKNNSRLSLTPKNYVDFNRTYSNFGKRFTNNNKNIVDYTMDENSRNNLRLKLIEKLKEEEEEKKKIEDELAQIENEEELLLMNAFKNDKYGKFE